MNLKPLNDQRKRAEGRKIQQAAENAARAERRARAQAQVLAQSTADEAKMARIEAANSRDARDIAIFKTVAREVLGLEMYEHLWELVKQRTTQQLNQGGTS